MKIWILFSSGKTIFYERAQRVSKILCLPRENKIHIFAPPCKILYITDASLNKNSDPKILIICRSRRNPQHLQNLQGHSLIQWLNTNSPSKISLQIRDSYGSTLVSVFTIKQTQALTNPWKRQECLVHRLSLHLGRPGISMLFRAAYNRHATREFSSPSMMFTLLAPFFVGRTSYTDH